MRMITAFFISILFIGFIHLDVEADGLNYVENDLTTQNIYDGIEYKKANTTVINDRGVSSHQHVNVVKKEGDANNVQVATWTKFTSTGKWTFGTVEEIARDFEQNNPGYRVLAAINGDYFAYPPTSINANINFSGDIIKPQNHMKYSSIGFDVFGNHLIETKNMNYGNYYVTIYDPNSNEILHTSPVQGLNAKILGENSTTVYFNSTSMNLDGAKKFLIEEPASLSFSDAHLFAKGQVSRQTDENLAISDDEFAVVTNDHQVIDLLKINPIVRIQKMMDGELVNINNVIGVDSQILKNGIVRSFDAIGGQSESNTKSRQPRTSIGFTDNGDVILATVDGRQATGAAGVVSQGVDLRELATIMKVQGSIEAYNLDGGGSSQLVIRNDEGNLETVNSPSEGPHFPTDHSYYRTSYRTVANAVLFVVPDVSVKTYYDEFTNDSLTLDYQVFTDETIEMVESVLIVNGERQVLDNLEGKLNLQELNQNSINAFSFLFTYKKNNETITRSFSSNIVDLSVDSGLREALEPRNFEVEFEKIENSNDVKIKVCYEDPDGIITKLSVLRKDNNQNLTALVQYAGCRAATLEDAKDGTEYSFDIIYYYNGNRESKKLENTYSYTYQIESTTTTTTTDEVKEDINDEPNESLPIALYILIPVGIVSLGIMGYIRFKRR